MSVLRAAHCLPFSLRQGVGERNGLDAMTQKQSERCQPQKYGASQRYDPEKPGDVAGRAAQSSLHDDLL